MSEDMIVADKGRPTKLLIVEDSITFAGILKRSILAKLDVEVVLCRDYSSTRDLLKGNSEDFFAALLDIVLPDAPNGEIVDLVVSEDIPSVVFTGEISDDLRDSMWAKRIVDYVPKVNFDDIEHVVSLVDRLRKNIFKTVLVVDDSSTSRSLCRELLEVFNFQVLEAANGKEALEIINSTEIHLLIVDYYMPVMEGPTLVKEIRKEYSKAVLPVIGFSSAGGASTSADFLKSGANDYISKPFVPEEFYCRVTNTVDTAEYIKTIKNISDNDSLTGIYTRSALFKYGEKLFAQQKRSESTLVAVMIDIDNIKALNDRYGQIVGDEIISHIASLLRKRFRKGDVVSRYGGDVFCVLCADMKLQFVESVFKELVENISSEPIVIGEHSIDVTVSIGVHTQLEDNLETMISGAEKMLRQAKGKGASSIECSMGC